MIDNEIVINGQTWLEIDSDTFNHLNSNETMMIQNSTSTTYYKKIVKFPMILSSSYCNIEIGKMLVDNKDCYFLELTNKDNNDNIGFYTDEDIEQLKLACEKVLSFIREGESNGNRPN